MLATNGEGRELPRRVAVLTRVIAAIEQLAPEIVLRFARFLGVGLVGLVADTLVFSTLYSEGAGAPVSRAVSLTLATLVTWSLNRHFTFVASGHAPHHEMLRYGLVALVVQGFNYALFLSLMYFTASSHPMLCLLASAVSTAAISFLSQNFFTFGRSVRGPLMRQAAGAPQLILDSKAAE